MKEISEIKELHGIRNKKCKIELNKEKTKGWFIDLRTKEKLLEIGEFIFQENFVDVYNKTFDLYDISVVLKIKYKSAPMLKEGQRYDEIIEFIEEQTEEWKYFMIEEIYDRIQEILKMFVGYSIPVGDLATTKDYAEAVQISYSLLYCVIRGIDYKDFKLEEHIEKDGFFKWISEYKIKHFTQGC
ncbi:MAG: hypothetical protein ACK5NU_16295 [Fusobacterium ulcerans]|uniref:hypothetical protein n=1 Tax=Fusobacterium ulcerans TaxID=861 RepID=UPI003A8A36A4